MACIDGGELKVEQMFSVAKDVSSGRKNKTSPEETRIVTLQKLWHRWTDPSYEKIENIEDEECRNEAVILYLMNDLGEMNAEIERWQYCGR